MKKLILTITAVLVFNEYANSSWTECKMFIAKHAKKAKIFTCYNFITLCATKGTLYTKNKFQEYKLEAEKKQLLKEQEKKDLEDKLFAEKFYNSHKFKQFVEQYRCNNEDEERVNNGDTSIGYLKIHLDRLENSCKMKNVIELNNLDKLAVAEKCLCKLKNGQWRILSKKVIPANDDTKISLQEIKQLVQFGKETGFHDWGLGAWGEQGNNEKTTRNIIRAINGKLIFIDSESRGFSYGFSYETMKYKTFPYWSTLEYIYHSSRGISDNALTAEAITWLRNEYENEKDKMKQHYKSNHAYLDLPYNDEYKNEKNKKDISLDLIDVSKACDFDKKFAVPR